MQHCQLVVELDTPVESYAPKFPDAVQPAVLVRAKVETEMKLPGHLTYNRDVKIAVVQHRYAPKSIPSPGTSAT